MSYQFVWYPTPLNVTMTLTPDDSGEHLVGVPYVHSSGREGQVCQVPDNTPDKHGATLEFASDGYLPLRLRGFLVLSVGNRVANLQVDDCILNPEPEIIIPPEPPPGPSNRSPEEIINDVFFNTNPDLETIPGCGIFTEDCCDALHFENSNAWGHIKKEPPQNQYNGHAVDALMLLAGEGAGIYDIIFSSASPEAKPAYNYKEPPNNELWFYPAEAYHVSKDASGKKILKPFNWRAYLLDKP